MKLVRRFVFAIPILVFAHSCAMGTFDYLTGKGMRKTVGYPAPEAENLDPETRLYSSSSGCVVYGTELLTHAPYNLALGVMVGLFGPMSGTYQGPYPDRDEALEALRRSRITIRMPNIPFGNVQEKRKNYVGLDCEDLKELVTGRYPPEADVPGARCAVYENSTVILGVPEAAILIAKENGEIYARYFFLTYEGPREQWK